MPLVLFAWMSDQAYFKELTDINTLVKLREKSEEEIMNDLLPFGFIENGQEEEVNELGASSERPHWLNWD